jgi:hypothetical protein
MEENTIDETKRSLFEYMELFDDDDAPDGAWQAILEDAVETFNEANGTNYDPNDAFHDYIENSGNYTTGRPGNP